MAVFTKKDLGLLLPDEQPGDPVSLRHTKNSVVTDQFQQVKPKVDKSTAVKRYRAGHVPEFAAGYEEDRGFVTASRQVRAFGAGKSSRGRQRVQAQVIVATPNDKPLHQQRQVDRAVESFSEELSPHNALDDTSSSDDDEQVNRRQQLRKTMLEKEKTGQLDDESHFATIPDNTTKPVVRPLKEATESSASSSSEYETDSDESDDGQVMMKPVFVPKKARQTIKHQEDLEAAEEARQKKAAEKASERKLASLQLVAVEIQREKEGEHAAGTTDSEMPDDTDGLNPEQEYRDWELRELRRIKRDRDQRAKRREEAEETLRRRNLTKDERRAEDEALKKNVPKEKTKLKFLQKYYHKGAFYMDESSVEKNDVRKRDASGATLEDNFNKEILPVVMQVKNFGKSGRTKYTHLAAEDTTRDSLWGQNTNAALRDKLQRNLSGVRDLDTNPSKKRKH